MTAPADNTNVDTGAQPEQPQAFAGFTAGPAKSRKTGSTGANMDAVDHLQKVVDAANNGEEAPQDPYKKSGLSEEFDNTEFMKLLTMLYGIKEIPAASVPHLQDFKLDNSKAKPDNADGTLYAKVGDAAVEITRDSITTNAAITPELAYKMAAAAALNPNYEAVTLSGSLEDRVMLTFAAKHFGLQIDESSKPSLTAAEAQEFAAKFHAYEVAAGLDESVCDHYMQEQTAGASAPAQKKAPAKPQPAATPAFA